MSIENVQKFYDLGKGNEEFDKEIMEAAVAGNIVQLAKEKGFEFTKEEHDEFIAKAASSVGELSDEQLEKVAGGFHIPQPQIKVTCCTCGWTSGWQNVASGKTVAILKGIHMAKTKLQHVNFKPDARIH